MTVETSGTKIRRFTRPGRPQDTDLPIGEADANIVDCPVCARPLATGSRRCPGCGTRLLAGIRLTKAVGFIAAGVALGALLGGGGVALVSMSRPQGVSAVVPAEPAVVTPSVVPVPTRVPVVPVDPAIPSAAVSALRQSAMVNQRVLADAERLAAAVAVNSPRAQDIAPLLRGLATNAGYGDRFAPDIARWDAGATVSADLVTFYAAIGAVARDGLAASMTNARAYADAARRMLVVLGNLPTLDAASRALATDADIDLPPLAPTSP